MLLTLLRWPPRRRPNRTGSRTAPKPFLSDSQWLLIADLFPDPCPKAAAGPRTPLPRRRPVDAHRRCPLERFTKLAVPSPATCWRRHRDWTRSGVLRAAWDRLLGKMFERRGLDCDTAIGDGSFSRAKKGATTWDVAIVETAPASSC